MKRFTWIPLIAGVVLLLVALPVFAADILNIVQPAAASPMPAVEGVLDRNLQIDDYELQGSGCESSGGITNPF